MSGTDEPPCRQWTFRRSVVVFLDLLGKLWTAPNTALGLAIGLPALAFGARIGVGDNAIRIERFPFGRGALTLGNCVIYARGTTPADMAVGMYGDPRRLNVGRHERAHTCQYQLLGPLFLPVYFLAGGISARNPFERAANDHAAGGCWWPRGLMPFASRVRVRAGLARNPPPNLERRA